MNAMNRRDFMKTIIIGGVAFQASNLTFLNPLSAYASGKYDIGECRSVKITCISETGWYDNQKFKGQVRSAGGRATNQWQIPWDQSNASGFSSLIDIESLDGTHHKILLDTGWNTKYMDDCFKREGIDRLLQSGEIEMLFISHEHQDHYMGLECSLRYNPEIKVLIPSTFLDEGLKFLKSADYPRANAKNAIPHTGELVQLQAGKATRLFEGCAAVGFDVRTNFRVHGEQSLVFNVKDKGLVCVSGCCHQTLTTFADFAQKKIEGGDHMYGLYGGLHIAPVGTLDRQGKKTIKRMAKYDFKKIASNHCTGKVAVEEMIKLGYPVVRGTGTNGSKSDLFIGNGDTVLFG